MLPDNGSQNRISRDAVVDFPQPDKPTIATVFPFGTVREDVYKRQVYSFAIDKSIIIQIEKQVNGFVAIGFAFL